MKNKLPDYNPQIWQNDLPPALEAERLQEIDDMCAAMSNQQITITSDARKTGDKIFELVSSSGVTVFDGARAQIRFDVSVENGDVLRIGGTDFAIQSAIFPVTGGVWQNMIYDINAQAFLVAGGASGGGVAVNEIIAVAPLAPEPSDDFMMCVGGSVLAEDYPDYKGAWTIGTTSSLTKTDGSAISGTITTGAAGNGRFLIAVTGDDAGIYASTGGGGSDQKFTLITGLPSGTVSGLFKYWNGGFLIGLSDNIYFLQDGSFQASLQAPGYAPNKKFVVVGENCYVGVTSPQAGLLEIRPTGSTFFIGSYSGRTYSNIITVGQTQEEDVTERSVVCVGTITSGSEGNVFVFKNNVWSDSLGNLAYTDTPAQVGEYIYGNVSAPTDSFPTFNVTSNVISSSKISFFYPGALQATTPWFELEGAAWKQCKSALVGLTDTPVFLQVSEESNVIVGNIGDESYVATNGGLFTETEAGFQTARLIPFIPGDFPLGYNASIDPGGTRFTTPRSGRRYYVRVK